MPFNHFSHPSPEKSLLTLATVDEMVGELSANRIGAFGLIGTSVDLHGFWTNNQLSRFRDRLFHLPRPLSDLELEAIAAAGGELRHLALIDLEIDNDGVAHILEDMPNLVSLDLGSNRIDSAGATSIAENGRKLELLSLSDNAIGDDGVLAIAIGLGNLVTLNVNMCGAHTDAAVAIAEHRPTLRHLHISENNIGGDGAKAIASSLHGLTELSIARCNMTSDSAIDIASNLTLLDELYIAGNLIGDGGAIAIAENLHNLTYLNAHEDTIGDHGAVAIANNLHNLNLLDLSDNNIGDNGATAVANNLPHLQGLYIGANNIGDDGATAIANNLPNLTLLNLSDTNIGDDGATAIANNLPNLTLLDLSDTNIGDDGATAIANNLHDLESLYLGANNIGDSGATAIANNLPRLKWLHLGANNISDSGATAIANNLPNLIWLDLSANDIGNTGATAIAKKLQTLTVLALSSAGVGDEGATAIAQNLRNLDYLYLASNNISDTGATAIAESLLGLTLLNLSTNSIGVDGATAVASNLGTLTDLYLNSCDIGTDGLAALVDKLRNLKNLGLADCGLGDDEARLIASNLCDLASLDLSNNSVGIGGIQAIADELTSLTYLGMSGSRIDDSGTQIIARGLPHLTVLYLPNNTIGPAGAAEIATNLSRLTFLNLHDNSLGDDGANAIASLTKLSTLDLGNNGIGDEGVTGLVSNMPRLRVLALDQNGITDDGAIAIAKKCARLTALRISRNRVGDNGAIAVAKSLTNLRTLTLHRFSLSRFFASANEDETAVSVGDKGVVAIAEGLVNLRSLDLDGNEAGDLGAVAIATNLDRLTQLDLRSNWIGNEGATALAKNLRRLRRIDIEQNRLSSTFADAAQAGLETLRQLASVADADWTNLWEGKVLFIGEGGAGKSSLLGALRGDEWIEGRDSTHGLEVTPLPLPGTSDHLQLHAWDFAGQEHYRPTHQIFFTAPAIYLIVWNQREGAHVGRVDEWLNTVRLRTKDTPRCVVVATHCGVGGHVPIIDKVSLLGEYGDELVQFVNVDSKPLPDGSPGPGVDELKQLLAETAQSLPEMGTRFPDTWTRIRSDLTPRLENGADRQSPTAPFLRYEDFLETAARSYDLKPEAALAVYRIAVLRGQWISSSQSEHPAADDLIITQPEWLAKAISYVIDDQLTRQANGLLQERRLSEIWANPDRDSQYEEWLYPTFLRLIEDFEIGYRVKQVQSEEETFGPRWLIAQLVNDQPDHEALNGVLPDDESTVLRRIIRFASRKSGGYVDTPVGLIYRLIVRLHRFSLGARDVRDAVHWKNGVVLKHETFGHIQLEADDSRLLLSAWGPQPERIITRVVSEVEELISEFWTKVEIRESVTCGTRCGRDDPGLGVFDVTKVFEARHHGSEMQCPVPRCSTFLKPEQLLYGYDATPLPAQGVSSTIELLSDRLTRDISERITEVRLDVNATRRELSKGQRDLAASIQETAKSVDLRFSSLINLRPTFIVPKVVDTAFLKRGWTKATVVLELYCEHSAKPLAEVSETDDDNVGRYRFELPRSYVNYLAPTVSVLAKLATGVSLGSEIAPGSEVLEDLRFDIESARNAITVVTNASDVVDEVIDLDHDTGLDVDVPSGPPTEELAIKLLQDLVASKDPKFGGLVRRKTADDRILWVASQFGKLYEPIPTARISLP